MKIITIFLLLLSCMTLYAGKDKTYQCSWHEKNADEFQSKFKEFKYTEKGMFYYLISNDSDNIYINIRVFDDNIKQQVLRSGFTVWFNTDGKKETKLGIVYPAGHHQMNENSDDPFSELLLIGFGDTSPALIKSEAGNFRGSIYSKDDNYLYYQLVMPFSKLPALPVEKKKNKELPSIGISHVNAGGEHPHQGGSGGYGGMHGGGMHGGGGGMHGGGGGMHGGMHEGGGMHGGGMYGNTGGSYGGEHHTPGKESGQSEITWIKNIRMAPETR